MKTKFIMAIMAVVLIMALVFLGNPGMTPMGAIGIGEEVATSAAIELPTTIPESGAVVIQNRTADPASMLLLVILVASIITLAVILRRGFNYELQFIKGRRGTLNSNREGTGNSRRARDCILPAAA